MISKVGSFISQGVYSVATPFHPFGGAVDVIVVEQQDGTYRNALRGCCLSNEDGDKNLDSLVTTGGDGGEKNEDTSVSICRNESDVDNAERSDGIENSELDGETRLYEFEGQPPSCEDSVESTDYRAYYERLEQADDQSSDSEVVLFSVDGHVLTAPISLEVDNVDNLQLSTPQFHLGPGEGADFDGDNEDYTSGQETWTADFGDIEASAPLNSGEDYSNAFGKVSENSTLNVEVVDEVQVTCSIDNVEIHSVEHISSVDPLDGMKKEDTFRSCLELTNLNERGEDSKSRDMDSSCIEVGVKNNFENSPQDSPLSIPSTEEIKDGVEASESNALIVDSSGCLGSDSISLHSVSNDLEWKEDQFDVSPQAQGVENSSGLSVPEQECSSSEPMQPQTGSSDSGRETNVGMGFEISLCGNLLHPGMGLSLAAEAFDAFRISEEVFKASAASIIKEENLIVRFKERYLSWGKAAPLVLGMAAFGLDLLDETEDTIHVELNETPKPGGDTPEITSTPSGRRWRLWPIPFRRVKTIQHTSSTSSTEEVFVDSESGSQKPHSALTPSPNAGSESPHKKLVRTNIPTTEQIASLNLKDGQNMITFSFSTMVLGTQQVDAHIYLWKWNARIVISDVDGTITKSDVLGQFMPLVGKDWTQSGVARLFSAIKENGYQLLFLSARAIVQAYLTRSFLLNLKQDGKTLPNGPVVISPDGLFPSLYREVKSHQLLQSAEARTKPRLEYPMPRIPV
ncbi:hypothetical protein IFM89_026195 [Coptis chinensis]|uniref:LNS2/PITP domain-containing protein n=1 Tax=Coptis chinensis TaxID=261450 RepID=A0A835HH62_9MAGN|nr:hypothetical protein IFM89_026195 [Coptis chinensis]